MSDITEVILSKYTKSDIALMISTFQSIRNVIATFAQSHKTTVTNGLKDLRTRPEELDVDFRFIENINDPGYEPGFVAGYLFALGVIEDDFTTSQENFEAAFREGISRG